MVAGASVTWTHCSVLFEVTWGNTVRVRADATMRPRGHRPVRADELTSLPSPSLPSPLPSPFPCGRSLLSARGCVRADVKNNLFIFIYLFLFIYFYYLLFIFLVVVAGLERDRIYN
jgi:hypothetical protein